MYNHFLNKIKFFLSNLSVIEVSSNSILKYGSDELNINSIFVKHHGFLQTSPEYEMKKLISLCYSDIYQICHVFRDKEKSFIHKKEFNMLEWYRIKYNHHILMKEIDIFLQKIIGSKPSKKISYQNIFLKFLSIDLNKVKKNQLMDILKKYSISIDNKNYIEKNDILEILLERIIAPNLGHKCPIFIYDYPLKQAILSRSNNKKKFVFGERFEIYIRGIEVGNGFYELKKYHENKQRSYFNNFMRTKMKKNVVKTDPLFFNAIKKKGLPNCSGVALGLDRLFMIYTKSINIKNV